MPGRKVEMAELLIGTVVVTLVAFVIYGVVKGSGGLRSVAVVAVDPRIGVLVARIEASLNTGGISAEEEAAIDAEAERLVGEGVPMASIEAQRSWERLVQACVIRDLTEGGVSNRLQMANMPYNLRKGETLIWSFPNVQRIEEKHVRTRHGGGSLGMSIRVAKGVWIRPSSYRGESRAEVRPVPVGRGDLGFTNRHVYFHDYGTGQSFRVPYHKIASFKEYKDGISYSLEAVTAKTQLMKFEKDDGWFAYDMARILASRAEG